MHSVGVESVMINVERLTLANFQTHNVVVVTALSTLCIAVFFFLLLQNSLCLRDFRVFVNFYAHAFVCVRVCALGVSTEGRCRDKPIQCDIERHS